MVMSSNKFEWENLLEHEDVSFLVDPNSMSPDERHELIEEIQEKNKANINTGMTPY